MSTRYVGIFNGLTDTRYPLNRTNAKAAGVGVDSNDSYKYKFNSNGTLKNLLAEGDALFSESVITTRAILAAENGKTFFLNLATGFVTTLPAPFAGARYTAIVGTAPSGGSYTIVTAGGAVANIIKGQQYPASGAAGDTGTADDTVTLVDGQAVAGDRVEFFSDGTSWFAYAYSAVAAGVTFTQASA